MAFGGLPLLSCRTWFGIHGLSSPRESHILFRTKIQSHEEAGASRRIPFPVDGAAGRTVRRESRFAAKRDLFVALYLRAKNNWRRPGGQARTMDDEASSA
jgi:hypothetical protein